MRCGCRPIARGGLHTPGNYQDLFARQPDGTFVNTSAPAMRGAVVTIDGGGRLTPHGADLIGRCPFHDDHEPSLVVAHPDQSWPHKTQ
jgi:hypothetical protein